MPCDSFGRRTGHLTVPALALSGGDMTLSSKNPSSDGPEARLDPRLALVVQAVVEVPGLPSRTYGVCEISKGGMFLAFKDAGSTYADLERHQVDAGTGCEIAFAAKVKDQTERVRVSAEIVRITRHGIGVRFATRNPPQLSALRDLFARVGGPGASSATPNVSGAG